MARTNLEALKAKCNVICNTCYVDDAAAIDTLEDAGLVETETAVPNDPKIVECAILIVKGWVETSRSENGISVATDVAQVNRNILFWCKQAGLDATKYVDGLTVLDDISDMW